MPLRQPAGEAPPGEGERGAPASTERADRIASNLRTVRARMASALEAAKRPHDAACLVGVTKKVGLREARELFELGLVDLGESRAPELERKARLLEAQGIRPRWHFIGHLQRNKARRVLRIAHAIHSVDSLRLLETLLQLAEQEDARPGLFLQVKLTNEDAKGGLTPKELEPALARVAQGALPLFGLMTMASQPDEEAPTPAATFARLRELAAALPQDAFANGAPRLSMGMSSDLEDALAQGAHLVRIGTDLFQGLPPSEGEG